MSGGIDHPSLCGVSFSSLPFNVHVDILRCALSDASDLLRASSTFRSLSKSWMHATDVALQSTIRISAGGSHLAECTTSLVTILLRCAPSLQELDLSRETLLTQSCEVLRALHRCRSLTSLRLDFCEKMAGQAVLSLFSEHGLFALRTLSASHCTQTIGNGSWIVNFRHLRELDVSWCRSFSPPPGWLRACSELVQLNVQGCEGLNLNEFSVDPHVLRIQTLNISFIESLDDSVLAGMARWPMLMELILSGPSYNIWSNGAWTAGGMDHFRAHAPHVLVKFTCT